MIWQCNHKFDGGKKCCTPHLDEETIKELFVKAVNILTTEKDEVGNAIGMNRISGKPLKMRGSGTLSVAGIPCLILGLRQGSIGAAVMDGHSGH